MNFTPKSSGCFRIAMWFNLLRLHFHFCKHHNGNTKLGPSIFHYHLSNYLVEYKIRPTIGVDKNGLRQESEGELIY